MFVESMKSRPIEVTVKVIHVLVCPDSGLMFNSSLDLVDNLRDAEIFNTEDDAQDEITHYGHMVNNRIEVKSFNITPV